MRIHEPMTLLTDYMLGALCVILAIRLLRHGPHTSRKPWAAAFGACAGAALLGGTYHGFLHWLDEQVSDWLWKATLLQIGLGAFCATVATARAHLTASAQRVVMVVAGLKLAAYAAGALSTDTFLIAIIDYTLAFCFVLAVHAWAWLRGGDLAGRWVVLGVIVSFLAAGIQAAGIAPHPQFNHNDLYHVVQMAGMWLLYKGASRSRRATR